MKRIEKEALKNFTKDDRYIEIISMEKQGFISVTIDVADDAKNGFH